MVSPAETVHVVTKQSEEAAAVAGATAGNDASAAQSSAATTGMSKAGTVPEEDIRFGAIRISKPQLITYKIVHFIGTIVLYEKYVV